MFGMDSNGMALAYLVQILVTVGLTSWVYKTLKTSFENTISDLRLKVEQLQKEIINLQLSENKWYQKYYKLLNIYKLYKCENNSNCPINAGNNQNWGFAELPPFALNDKQVDKIYYGVKVVEAMYIGENKIY